MQGRVAWEVMRDVVMDLRSLEHRAETAVKGRESATEVCVGLGVEARDLGVLLGMSRLPAGAEPDIRERAMLLTHHGEALARAALAHGEVDRIRELMQQVEVDTHLLRGALEAAEFGQD